MTLSIRRGAGGVFALALLALLVVFSSGLYAQGAAGTIQGVVVDQRGQGVPAAAVTLTSTTEAKRTVLSGADGKFAIADVAAGNYTVQATAIGFTKQEKALTVSAGTAAQLTMQLGVASVAEEVTVEADGDPSLATELATVKPLLDMASPRTEISSKYIRQFTSPVTDFSDITQAAPGTVSYSTNGIGNGQAKTWFRGFKDGDFTTTWDGVPFQDSNDPTHHSWAYVPAPAISYVDFDRSPGTASDVGPTNFAGSVHYFSPKMGNTMSILGTESYGSFNTNQYQGQFNSGSFWKSKANLWFEGHHMTSDGYQTNNTQQRTAGTVKFNYRFSDKTNLTLVGTSVIVDSNTPNNDPTRQQVANHGDNYIMDKNALNPDGSVNTMYYKFYFYHVPTNFEVITFTKELGRGWRFETKPYTYSYSNHQHYYNTQNQDLTSSSTYAPVSVKFSTTGAINKLNQYNRGGNITTASAASRFGVFRIGNWYEYTTTHRYQVASNAQTWVDSLNLKDLKFHEYFITNSAQPYIEYQLVAIPKLTITAGVKSALYTMSLNQLADGKTVGNLGCTSTTIAGCAGISVRHDAYYNNILPSFEANYRLLNNWSIYGQYGRGSEIPPSSVFDVTGAQVATTPKPTVASTVQGGTVLKLDRVLFDADAYHITYDSAYASFKVSDPTRSDFGDSYWYSTPNRNTIGFEAESNIAVTHGLSLVVNGTIGQAKYNAAPATTLNDGKNTVIPASPEQWVANVAKNTESGGITYQEHGLDIGFFNKRVGSRFVDNSSVHEATALAPFWMSNLFVNYSLRRNSIFDQSKIKLSINNLFDNHDLVGLSPGVSPTTAVPYAPNSQDQLQLLPARSVMITFQIGLSPRER